MNELKLLSIGLCALSLSSCKPARPVSPPPGSDQITQVSVINALMIGRYDGVMPITELSATATSASARWTTSTVS